jgi:histidinol-phosphate/aromatic aminotransferase/cobyric acid decarboxylase-like protein
MARSGVDILHTGAHSASYFDLSRSMGEDVKIVDFCIPCNPYFPTPEMFDELSRELKNILKYYPSDSATITAKLASVLGLHPQTVAMANGSTELITWIDHLLIKSSVAIPIPTFGRWTDQPLETGKRVDMFSLRERDAFRLNLDEYVQFIRDRGSRVAVVCNVNNPDGGYLARRDVIRFMDALPDLDLVVIDESFIDFSDAEQYPSVGPEAVIRPNVVVLKSLGKNFGLHGIRFGYLMANPAIAGKIAKALPKWNLNSLAEKVVFMIQDHIPDYEESLRLLSRDRRTMAAELSQVPGLTVFPSQGNFILVKLPTEWSGVGMRDYLVSNHGIYTRECGNKLGMSSQFMRLVVRPAADVDRLIDGMEDYSRQWRGSSSYTASSAAYPTSPSSSPSYPTSPGPYATNPSTYPTSPGPYATSAASHASGPPSYSSGPSSYAKTESAPVETGYNRRWNLEDERENVTQYPSRRASGY